MRGICQSAAVCILGGQDDVCRRELPVDAQGGVVPGDAAFAIRGVVVITLVQEDGFIAEHGKAMGEAAGNEELAVVLCTEFHGHMLPESGGAVADINRHIEHTALHTTHQLALAMRGTLVVQPAHHAVARHGFIVLHKGGIAHFLAEFAVGEGFEEITAGIAENAWFDNFHIGNGCGDNIHKLQLFSLQQLQQSLSILILAHGLSHLAKFFCAHPTVPVRDGFETGDNESLALLQYFYESGCFRK